MPFIKNTILLTKRVYTAEPPVIIGQVGSGEITAAYLSNTGRIWTWGENTRGQLGQNLSTAAVAFVPASIAGVTKTFCTLATTGQTHLAIDKNGMIWGWGNNSSGQLGDNTVISKFTPVSVKGATKTFCKVGGGAGTPLAIDKYGRLWAWGSNSSGNIGDNSIISKLTPVSVLGAVKTFCEISKYAGSLAIDKYGQVWAWGYNTYGNLGDNSTVSKLTPVSICGTKKTFCTINASAAGVLAIDKNGRLWGWGYNANGNLGDNSTTNKSTPVSVCGAVKTFCKISLSSQASYAIDKNGKLWAWGVNRLLGANLYTSGNTLTPISVAGALANRIVCDVAGASSDYAFAIDSKGVVWAWGYGHYGGLGNPAYKSVTSPFSVASTKTFCDVVAGFDATNGANHFSAIDNNGRMWSWGFNSVGQFGDNTIIAQDKVTPLSVVGNVKTFCKVAAGGQTSIAIDKNGTVWAWGDNAGGQLGNNSSISQLTPVSILGATKTFCTISAGQFHSLAIDKNGKAWGWGSNGNGRLGDNSITQRLTPVAVLGSTKTFCKIVGSSQHSLAIDKNGRAWAWGNNTTAGLLGNNSITSFRTPISVLGAVKTFCQIAARGSIVMAIDKNGRVWGWGAGTSGGLGTNSLTTFRTPVSVAGVVKTFCKISVGANSFCVAIDKNGRAWAWGNNQYGQLGDNTLISKCTPVSVAGTVKTFCQITAGQNSVVAIDKNGKAWAWGLNTPPSVSGNILIQTLGINTPMFRATPIRVCNL